MEQQEADHACQNRANHNTYLTVIQKICIISSRTREGEIGYEERHCEANAAEHGNRSHHRPVATLGHRGETKLDGEPREQEDAEEFTKQQAADDGEAYTLGYAHRLDVKQEDAGVGKGEEGHYQVVDNGV